MDLVPRCLAARRDYEISRLPSYLSGFYCGNRLSNWTKVDTESTSRTTIHANGCASEAKKSANERDWTRGWSKRPGERVCELRCLITCYITTRCSPKRARQWCGCWSGWGIRWSFPQDRHAADRCTGTRATRKRRCRCCGGSSTSSKHAEAVVSPSTSCVAMMRDHYPIMAERLKDEKLKGEVAKLLPKYGSSQSF